MNLQWAWILCFVKPFGKNSTKLLNKQKLLLSFPPTIFRYRFLSSNQNTFTVKCIINLQEAEEARCVGFMRSGRVVAEGSPIYLSRVLDCNSLEDVFYKVCTYPKEQVRSLTKNSLTIVGNKFDFRFLSCSILTKPFQKMNHNAIVLCHMLIEHVVKLLLHY